MLLFRSCEFCARCQKDSKVSLCLCKTVRHSSAQWCTRRAKQDKVLPSWDVGDLYGPSCCHPCAAVALLQTARRHSRRLNDMGCRVYSDLVSFEALCHGQLASTFASLNVISHIRRLIFGCWCLFPLAGKRLAGGYGNALAMLALSLVVRLFVWTGAQAVSSIRAAAELLYSRHHYRCGSCRSLGRRSLHFGCAHFRTFVDH